MIERERRYAQRVWDQSYASWVKTHFLDGHPREAAGFLFQRRGVDTVEISSLAQSVLESYFTIEYHEKKENQSK